MQYNTQHNTIPFTVDFGDITWNDIVCVSFASSSYLFLIADYGEKYTFLLIFYSGHQLSSRPWQATLVITMTTVPHHHGYFQSPSQHDPWKHNHSPDFTTVWYTSWGILGSSLQSSLHHCITPGTTPIYTHYQEYSYNEYPSVHHKRAGKYWSTVYILTPTGQIIM